MTVAIVALKCAGSMYATASSTIIDVLRTPVRKAPQSGTGGVLGPVRCQLSTSISLSANS